jgi:MFS family permease
MKESAASVPEPRYRWIVVAAGAILGCVALGALFSLPVLVGPITRNTGWSTAAVSSAMTIGFLTMAVGSFVWGTLSDRFGARWICVAGSVLMSAGLMLASGTRSVHGFQLAFGLMLGAAASALFAPVMACVTGWFQTRRSLAVSLVSAGFGVAPLTMSPWVAWLAGQHDWREVMQILALFVPAVMIPVSLLIRRPPLDAPAMRSGSSPDSGLAAETPTTIGHVLRSPKFIVLAATNFFCCATHSGPIFHTVNYAVMCGISLAAAVSIYSMEGLAGLGGRIAFGFAGDYFGARRTLVVGLLMQAIFAACYLFATRLEAFYIVAALFGFTYGGVMPLYAVLARESFPPALMGTVIGGTATAGSLGMATGPLLGGWLLDTLGSYLWLYLSACGFGLVAVAMAATYRVMSSRPGVGVVAQSTWPS